MMDDPYGKGQMPLGQTNMEMTKKRGCINEDEEIGATEKKGVAGCLILHKWKRWLRLSGQGRVGDPLLGG